MAGSSGAIDLTVKKLPTETVHTTSKKPKYADKWLFPNCDGASRVIFNGPSQSGKTNFAISLLCDPAFMRGFFDKIYVFCPSAGIQEDYAHLTRIYGQEVEVRDFTAAECMAIFDALKKVTELCKTNGAPIPATLFLFDDLINVPGFDKTAATLCTKARNWGISVWILSQSLMSLSRLMRLQATNVFAFSPNQSEIERLAVECTNAIAPEELVERMVRAATRQRYRPFHINRQAPAHLQYRMGLTEFFELHDPAEDPSGAAKEKEKQGGEEAEGEEKKDGSLATIPEEDDDEEETIEVRTHRRKRTRRKAKVAPVR